MAKATRLFLPDKVDLDVRDLLDHLEHVILAMLLELHLKLQRAVEVILDRTLVAPRDDQKLLDARGDSLLDDELDRRRIDDGQHLLRLSFRRRQETRAKTRCRDDRLANFLLRHHYPRMTARSSSVFFFISISS